MPKDLTQEEQDALATLAKGGRLMVILLPDDAPDEFAARLTAWSNFILDTKILLPMPLPVTRRGDGLVCPYCGSVASQNPQVHATDCEWRKAILRWGAAQLQIAEEFPEV